MRIGIDLGGTKIAGILMGDDGHVLAHERVATPAGDYSATLDAVANLVVHLEAGQREAGQREAGLEQPAVVGVGTPGSPSPNSGLMRNCNSTCLNGHPLKQDLEARLKRLVTLANDADCFALSEAVDGAGADAGTVFGVILGTGVGGGVVVNQQLLDGANAIAGEWGHNPFPVAHYQGSVGDSRACYCGRTDCIETFLSGPGLSLSYRQASGRELAAQQIAEAASNGEAQALTVLSDYCEQLACALATVINVLDPHAIILGGGLSNIPLLYEEVPKRWRKYIFSDVYHTQLLPARYGDDSGVRGAAWL